MIRLRQAVIRLTRRRWVGPLVIAIVVLLIAFVALHEGFAVELGGTCATVVLVLVAATGVRRPPLLDVQLVTVVPLRAPPRRLRPPAFAYRITPSPLRL